MDAPPTDSFRRDARVIGLVGIAHGLSHVFQLALPPLFPLLRAEFDVSWTLLGALVGLFYAASGITQFSAGFLVDRVGARPVLLGGLALLAGGTLLASLVPGIGWLFPVVVLMGIGNGVFHPADFAILNANVAQQRLGHAYSTHGIGGNRSGSWLHPGPRHSQPGGRGPPPRRRPPRTRGRASRRPSRSRRTRR